MSYLLGMISAFHSLQAVLVAAGITFFVSLGVTLFACQTKFDFTSSCWLLVVMLVMSLVLWGIAIAMCFAFSVVLQGVYGGIGAVLMCLCKLISLFFLNYIIGRIIIYIPHLTVDFSSGHRHTAAYGQQALSLRRRGLCQRRSADLSRYLLHIYVYFADCRRIWQKLKYRVIFIYINNIHTLSKSIDLFYPVPFDS
jgi:hypothetical protein